MTEKELTNGLTTKESQMDQKNSIVGALASYKETTAKAQSELVPHYRKKTWFGRASMDSNSKGNDEMMGNGLFL